MARLLLRNLFDLVLRIRLIRTHLCRRRRMPVPMSLLRLWFRMLTCHPGDPDVPLDPHDLPPGPSDDPRPSGLPYDDPPDPSPSAHPGLPGHSVSASPPDGPVVPVLPDAPVTPGIIVPPTVPDVDMGLGGVKRNSAETSDDPPATKARPSQPTSSYGQSPGG